MFHNSNLCSLIATIQCFPLGAFFTRFVYLRLSDPAALIRPASQRSPCGLTWPAFGLDHIRTTIRNSCNTPSPSVIERRSNPFFIPSFVVRNFALIIMDPRCALFANHLVLCSILITLQEANTFPHPITSTSWNPSVKYPNLAQTS